MPRIDAHQHFWDPARADYPWMTDAVAAIRRAYAPADLAPHLAATGMDATVLVQTRASMAETREFLAIAEQSAFVAGVVGWVDLTAPDVAAQLASLRAAPGGGALVGIRHQVHDEPDADWLGRPDVRRGLAAVADAGLVFDLLVRERELAAAAQAVAALPGLRFVLDHVAKPPIFSGTVPAGWRAGIARLAAHSNVWCKVSGLVTEATWERWTVDDLRPYVAEVVGAFGLRRLLFGSDWPVCLLAATYERVVATAGRLAAETGADAAAAEAIFGGTALRVYGLTIGARVM